MISSVKREKCRVKWIKERCPYVKIMDYGFFPLLLSNFLLWADKQENKFKLPLNLYHIDWVRSVVINLGQYCSQVYLVVSGDIFNCHNSRKQCYRHLVCRNHGFCLTFNNAQASPMLQRIIWLKTSVGLRMRNPELSDWSTCSQNILHLPL